MGPSIAVKRASLNGTDSSRHDGVVLPLPERAAQLTQIARADLIAALGWLGRGPARWLVARAGDAAAAAFARDLLAFDQVIAEHGLTAAARQLLARHVGELWVRGREHLPPRGPVLLIANHPGLSDALALIVAVGDDTLQLVAAARPFFTALPALSKQLILVGNAGEYGTARAILSQLRAGGRVATFPAGTIEPDPLRHPAALLGPKPWQAQVAPFARRLPAVPVIPVVIGGVLTSAALRQPLARVHWSRAARERAAAMLQVLRPSLRPAAVRLVFGPPLREWSAETLDATYRALDQALRAPTGWTVLPLAGARPATSS
jgi:1-acyl-sn-glycerol-3-phosphate acyltransferase